MAQSRVRDPNAHFPSQGRGNLHVLYAQISLGAPRNSRCRQKRDNILNVSPLRILKGFMAGTPTLSTMWNHLNQGMGSQYNLEREGLAAEGYETRGMNSCKEYMVS